MKGRNVLAKVLVDHRQISAHFHTWTGRLIISEGPTVVESIRAPDSWIALAAVNTASGWGTRPTSADLQMFLEWYVATYPKFVGAKSGPASPNTRCD